jgi:hypothetical protein
MRHHRSVLVRFGHARACWRAGTRQPLGRGCMQHATRARHRACMQDAEQPRVGAPLPAAEAGAPQQAGSGGGARRTACIQPLHGSCSGGMRLPERVSGGGKPAMAPLMRVPHAALAATCRVLPRMHWCTWMWAAPPHPACPPANTACLPAAACRNTTLRMSGGKLRPRSRAPTAGRRSWRTKTGGCGTKTSGCGTSCASCAPRWGLCVWAWEGGLLGLPNGVPRHVQLSRRTSRGPAG